MSVVTRSGQDLPGRGSRRSVKGDEKLGQGHPAMWFAEETADFEPTTSVPGRASPKSGRGGGNGHAAAWASTPASEFEPEQVPGLRRPGTGGREGGTTGHTAAWSAEPAIEMADFPEGGGYPKGFLQWAYRTLSTPHHVVQPDRVLHLCSGSLRVGIRVDIRPETEPDMVADCRDVPLPDASIDWIMADPPYTPEYAANLYGTARLYPRPQQILREAARLLRPGGRLGILHFQVPMIPKGCGLRILNVWGITTGSGYAIRAWSVFEKAHAELGL